MGKTAVIYKSKYGSTKKYAQWIAEELEADLFDVTQVNTEALGQYQTIIFGGGLYASGIIGSDFLVKNYELLAEKQIIVFTVGLANPQLTDYTNIIEKNFPPMMRESIKIFHLRGAIDYKKINITHKAMMALLKKKVTKIDEKDQDEETKMMLETYGQTVDFTDKSTVKDLVDYCMTK
jgi:menaquinone-dependent protoporphyrinogen IX oxidase